MIVSTADGKIHKTLGYGYIMNLGFHITKTFKYNLISTRVLDKIGWTTTFGFGKCIVTDPTYKLQVFECNGDNQSSYSIRRTKLIKSLEEYWNKRSAIQVSKPSRNVLAVSAPLPRTQEVITNNTNIQQNHQDIHLCSACNNSFIKNKVISNYLLWHSRLHKPLRTLREICNKQLVKGLKIDFQVTDANLPPCAYCIRTGMQNRGFSHDGQRVPKRPFETVHVDLKGPITPSSIANEQYMLGITDTYSKYTVIYFLKQKSEAFRYMEQFITTTVTEVTKIWREIEQTNDVLHINLLLGQVISDQGGEFTSANFINACTKFGVQVAVTPAYTPQLNGQIESKWKSIMHGCRKWLLQAQLPTRYWPYAARHEVYIQNRTNVTKIMLNKKVVQKTPYHILFKKAPSLSHMRQFGCTVHTFIKEEQRANPNFSDRASLGRLLGFGDNKVIHSAIIVNENTINLIKPIISHVDRDSCKFNEVSVSSYNSLNGEQVVSPDIVDDIETQENIEDDDDNDETDTHLAKKQKPSLTINNMANKVVELTQKIEVMEHEKEDTTGIISLTDALKGPERENWIKAITEELEAIQRNRVWTLVERPFGKKIIGTRWVLRSKLTEELIRKLKARLVVLGYQAIDGIDFESLLTFAPVAKMTSFRIFLSIITQYSMVVVQADVDTAFQNAVLDEDIYISLPLMFQECINPPNLMMYQNPCLKLNRALYGLPQAPKAWFKTIDAVLKAIGYISLNNEPCLYKKVDANGNLIALTVLYVDDLLIANTLARELEIILQQLQEKFKIKINREIKRILGINVTIDQYNGLSSINQEDKIQELASIIGIDKDSVKLPRTPLDQHVNWFLPHVDDKNAILNEDKASLYRTLLGKAMYIMTATRPDICFAISMLSRANKQPTEKHMVAITHMIKYLYNTQSFKITFRRQHPTSFKLLAYSDADWATDKTKRRSQTGGIIFLGGSPIVWVSSQQTTVALSSTEAEINALREVTKQVLWTRNVMKEIGLTKQKFVPILEDNTSAIQLVHNPAVNNVNRHTDISHKFITENIIEFKTISVEYVPSQENIADLFTKLVKEPLGTKLIHQLFNLYLTPNGANLL